MGAVLPPETGESLPWQVRRWHVAFYHTVSRRVWLHAFNRGRYRHVEAFGYAAAVDGWVSYAPTFRGTEIKVIPHGESFLRVMEWVRGRADLVAFEARPARRTFWRPGFYCVPAIINLTGVRSSAVTPGGLFRDLMRHGGQRSSFEG